MDRPLQVYWLLAFGITWDAGGLALLTGNIRNGAEHTLHPLHYLAAFGPSIAGFIMAAATEGWAGVRHLLARIVPVWANVPWYAAVLLGFPAVSLAVAWLLDRDSLSGLPSWDRLICLVPLTLVLDTGPLGEEFGWRGFALPRLLRRWPPLTAALILAAIWWAWHLPTFFIPALSQSRLSIPLFFVNTLALSLLMTGLYLRTGGDLLPMILVHVMANWCPVPFRSEVCAEVALAALVLSAGWLRPKARPGDVDRTLTCRQINRRSHRLDPMSRIRPPKTWDHRAEPHTSLPAASDVTRSPKADIMKRSFILTLVSLMAICLGCSRTVTGGFTDSPDKTYRMYGRVYGALGRKFTDDTDKTVRISIVTNDSQQTLIFRREIRVKGSDVGWDCSWDTNNNLVVTVQGKQPVRLSLVLDKQTGIFREMK